MANWDRAYQSLQGLQDAFGQRGDERRKFMMAEAMAQREMQQKYDMEIGLLREKAMLENQNPFAQFEQKAKIAQGINNMADLGVDVSQYMPYFQGGQGQPQPMPYGGGQVQSMPQGGGFVPPQFSNMMSNQTGQGLGQNDIVPTDFQMTPFGGLRPTKFENAGFKLSQREKEKRQDLAIKEEEPLGKDAASAYSGATQGIRDVGNIIRELGISSDGSIKDINKTKDLIYKANLNIEGTGARDTFVPFAKGVYKSSKLTRGGDDGARIGNLFMTMSENLLRARTGAAAPDPEVVREYARSLLRSYIESPETWISKLKQNEEYMVGVASGIKPTKWEQDVGGYKSFTFKDKVQMPSMNEIQSAKSKGFKKYNTETGEWLK